MQIKIAGELGYLGSYLARALEPNAVHNFNSENPAYVINCIGLPSLEECEKHPEKSLESNYTVVERLIQEYPMAKLINFSSYYVYDDDGLCKEGDNTTDAYVYCRHKLMAEKIVTESGGINFRIGKLFGSNPRREQKKFTEYVLEGEGTLQTDRVVFNPTSLIQVFSAVVYALGSGALAGTYNLSNKGAISHWRWAEACLAFAGRSRPVNVTGRLPRPFHNYGRFAMDTTAIEQHIKLTPWRDDLEHYVHIWKSHKLKNR